MILDAAINVVASFIAGLVVLSLALMLIEWAIHNEDIKRRHRRWRSKRRWM